MTLPQAACSGIVPSEATARGTLRSNPQRARVPRFTWDDSGSLGTTPALARQSLTLGLPPVVDLLVIAREQDFRHRVPAILRRTRITRRAQLTIVERIGT